MPRAMPNKDALLIHPSSFELREPMQAILGRGHMPGNVSHLVNPVVRQMQGGLSTVDVNLGTPCITPHAIPVELNSYCLV